MDKNDIETPSLPRSSFHESEPYYDLKCFTISDKEEELLYSIFKKLVLRTKDGYEYCRFFIELGDLNCKMNVDPNLYLDKLKSMRENILDCFNAGLYTWIKSKDGRKKNEDKDMINEK